MPSEDKNQHEGHDSRDSLRAERKYPEKNLLGKLDGFLRFFGALTRRNIARPELQKTQPERPLSMRMHRAKLFTLFKGTKHREERKAIIAEANVRDEVLKEFLTQGDVTVDLPGSGELRARFTDVHPPAERAIKDAPPVVLIPGISNDLACVDTLAHELALAGRRVIVIAYPDSFMGTVTREFAEEVERSETYAPHAKFFANAVAQLLPNNERFELWGFSTGGPIAAEMLARDPNMSKRVTDAAFLNPAGSTAQEQHHFIRGGINELRGWLSSVGDLPSYVLTHGREDTPGVEPESPEQRKLKEKTFNGMAKLIQKPAADWKHAKVRDGGSIVVVACKQDDITRCRQTFNGRTPLPNAQTRIVESPGRHSEPLLHPKEIILKIAEARK